MKKIRQYTITWYTTKGGFQCWRTGIDAENKKQAKERFKLFWTTHENYGNMHPFHIEAHLLKPGDQFLFNFYQRISADEWRNT